MAKKQNRVQVILECTEARNQTEVPGVSRYVTVKNRKNDPERMERMKYSKFLKRHTLHREVK